MNLADQIPSVIYIAKHECIVSNSIKHLHFNFHDTQGLTKYQEDKDFQGQ